MRACNRARYFFVPIKKASAITEARQNRCHLMAVNGIVAGLPPTAAAAFKSHRTPFFSFDPVILAIG
jgi:hypothetical protein